MKTLAEIEVLIDQILHTKWERRTGKDVPDAELVKLGNDSVEMDGAVLYADLVDSTGLVQGYKDWFAAEMYKIYLLGACELIRNNGGEITAFDGDRVMAVFVGGTKKSNAAKCGLQINWLVKNSINAKIKTQYPETSFQLRHAVGIDSSKLLVAKTGVRGSNDLVWVGRAANYAAKLCALREGDSATFITEDVFTQLNDSSKIGGQPPQVMWTKFIWSEMGLSAYRSSWWWKP